MKLKVTKTDVWAAMIKDQPGGLAEKLQTLARAGVNLEFLIGRRAPDRPGQGVVFITPIKGAKQKKAAEAAGFQKTTSLHSVRVQGQDKAGIGACMARALSEAGLNLRGISAAAIGKQFVTHLALDSAADAAKAIAILKKLK
jgi:hypothetical protein